MLRMADNLRSESMPPEDEPRPDAEELESINSWLDATLIEEGGARGRVTIRRLNRVEYNNTIRDLIGLDLRPADEFPSDDIGYGFDNVADVLSTPPILLEMYQAAADKVIGEAFRDRDVRERLLNRACSIPFHSHSGITGRLCGLRARTRSSKPPTRLRTRISPATAHIRHPPRLLRPRLSPPRHPR